MKMHHRQGLGKSLTQGVASAKSGAYLGSFRVFLGIALALLALAAALVWFAVKQPSIFPDSQTPSDSHSFGLVAGPVLAFTGKAGDGLHSRRQSLTFPASCSQRSTSSKNPSTVTTRREISTQL